MYQLFQEHTWETWTNQVLNYTQNSASKNNLQIWHQIAFFFFFQTKKFLHSFFFFTATQISFSKLAVLFYFCVCLGSFTLRWSSAVKSPIFSDWTFLTGFCGGETFLPAGENPDPNQTKELVLSSSSSSLFFPADENFRMRRRNCFPSGMWIFIGGFREFQQVFPPKKNSFLKPRRIWIPKKKRRRRKRLIYFCSFMSRFLLFSFLLFIFTKAMPKEGSTKASRLSLHRYQNRNVRGRRSADTFTSTMNITKKNDKNVCTVKKRAKENEFTKNEDKQEGKKNTFYLSSCSHHALSTFWF